MSLLLDSCIYIDILRNSTSAAMFVKNMNAKPAMSVVTVTELYYGARSIEEERRIENHIQSVLVLPIDAIIGQRAGVNMKHYHRSHNIDFPDALIAATAEHHELELVTLNLKHFPMFPKLKRPY